MNSSARGGKKALEAERAAAKEARREVAALRKQLEDVESSKLTDLEKVQQQVTSLTQRAEIAELTALRKSAISAHGLNADDEVFLTATDEAGIAEQAKRLAERFKPGTPQPDPSQGVGAGIALNSDALEASLRQALGI